MRAGCGVGAGRAGRASTPFHAGTAARDARARRPAPTPTRHELVVCVYRI